MNGDAAHSVINFYQLNLKTVIASWERNIRTVGSDLQFQQFFLRACLCSKVLLPPGGSHVFIPATEVHH